MTISTNLISGLASGFDWRSMIDQLMEIEHRSVDLIEERKTEFEAKRTEWNNFNTKLLSLKSAAESLKNPKAFSLFSSILSTDNTTVNAEDLLSVSFTDSASPGSYTIQVTNLAKAQKLASNPFTSQSADLGSAFSGEFVLNGKVITVNATDSLLDVAHNINSLNNGNTATNVTASILRYSINDYRLILTSDTTGENGISLLNGSRDNIIQRFGWKDNQTEVVKNSITSGAQSDRFTTPYTVIQSLLGLTEGENSTGSLTIGGTAVNINLGTMSLTDIKDAINGAAIPGVTASIISENAEGRSFYRLHIEGTQNFVDENNILNTLGVLDHSSIAVSGKVSTNAMTSEGAIITHDTLLVNIDGYMSFTEGDHIQMTGTKSGGEVVNSTFNITSSATVGDLMTSIESEYASSAGDIIAYLTSDGKLRVDDGGEGGNLSVILTDTISDGSLEFVDGNGAFENASARRREVVEGKDASLEIDGVTIKSSSNVIDDVIDGTTLNLLNEESSTTITLQIKRDMDGIKERIQGFIESYNEIMSYINTQFSYNEVKGKAGGVLFGDATLHSIKSQIGSLMTQKIWGVNNEFSILALIGIKMNNNLILSMDEVVFNKYLKTNFNDVKSLFIGQGITSGNNISYVGHGLKTKAGEYAVHIQRAATQALETGNVNLLSGGVEDVLTINQGEKSARVNITSGMNIDDIVHAINDELDNVYTQSLVGDKRLYTDTEMVNEISANSPWNSIYDDTGNLLSFTNGENISFSGTSRTGKIVTGTYQINDTSNDTMQGLLSSIENAFSNQIKASINTSGVITISDTFDGYSELTLDALSHPSEGAFFGAVDVTLGAADGSQEGREVINLTAEKDGGNHLVIRSNDYGNMSFSISQENADNNYHEILYSTASNTTDESAGKVYITENTCWSQIHGANVSDGETIRISGKARDGVTDIDSTYTIGNIVTDSISGFLTSIENAFSAQGTLVDAFVKDGKLYLEDLTPGNSSISLTLTVNNEGGGNLSFGALDHGTERDLDLGLINGTISGLDVAGSINGEPATGSGQVIKGESGNGSTDGLSVKYTGTEDNVDAGTIKVLIGVADMFNKLLYHITDAHEGNVAFKMESLDHRIEKFSQQIEKMETRIEQKMERMINRFVLMETALSKIQSQSNWLSSQISALNG